MSGGAIRVGGAIVDLGSGAVIGADGVRTELRPKTASLLRALAERPGGLVSKDELLEKVWPGLHVDEDALVQCVGEIRRAVGPGGKEAIRTHAKRGYSLQIGPFMAAAAPAHRRRAVVPLAALAIGAVAIAAAVTVGVTPPPGASARAGAVATPEGRERFEGPVVAVFPLVPLSEGARWDRLARALTEDIIADLAQNPWLFVLADSATRTARAPSAEKGRLLGAGFIVTGSIRVDGGRAQVAAALTDGLTGRHLWSRRLEGPVRETLALQRSASEAIVGALAASWSGPIAQADKRRARGRGLDDLAAYELYLRAGEHIDRRTPTDYAEAETLLQRAVTLEPAFGEAWAKLSYLAYTRVHPEMPQAEIAALWRQGDAAALEGYRVAPERPYTLAQAAGVVGRQDPGRAAAMVRRAAELAPNDADMLANLAFRATQFPTLAPDAAKWIEHARRLHPSPPTWYDWNRGAVMVVLGRYGEAADSYGRAPDHIVARGGHVAALALSGEVEAARARMAALLAEAPHFSASWFADAEGLHPDVAAVYARGFALAGAPD